MVAKTNINPAHIKFLVRGGDRQHIGGYIITVGIGAKTENKSAV